MTRGTRPTLDGRRLALELLPDSSIQMKTISERTGITTTTLYKMVEAEGIDRPKRFSMEGECSVDGCNSPIESLRLCGKHYQRFRAHGTTDAQVRPSVEDRFWAKVEILSSGCWIWLGATVLSKSNRYGVFDALNEHLAHRAAYRLFKGDIPKGLHIDHLCSVTLCVNFEHLEAVTVEENNRRSRARGRHPRKSMTALEFGAWAFGAKV